MSKNINVEVNSIRLEETSDTPILLLLDPSTQKVLPIWIGTIEAVSIAYAQEGIQHDRPQTHDLLLNIIEALDASINEKFRLTLSKKVSLVIMKGMNLLGIDVPERM